jgi:transcription initiation factor TFIIIB Brf1 subunit/transcription initiation factor TFIIB
MYKTVFLHKQNDKKMIMRGKNKIAVLAVCFYENSKTETAIDDILRFFDINITLFDKTRKILQENDLISNTSDSFSNEYIHRICNKINLHIKIIELICRIYSYLLGSDIQIVKDHQCLIYSIIYFVLTELNDTVFIEGLKNMKKINIDITIKNSKILTKNKIKIFNHVKNNK